MTPWGLVLWLWRSRRGWSALSSAPWAQVAAGSGPRRFPAAPALPSPAHRPTHDPAAGSGIPASDPPRRNLPHSSRFSDFLFCYEKRKTCFF